MKTDPCRDGQQGSGASQKESGTHSLCAPVAPLATPCRTPGRKTERQSPRRTPTLPEPVIVARWSKNRKGDAIALILKTYEGVNVIDLRTFYPTKAGTLSPGRGFCALIGHLPRLAKEFANAVERARQLGLIEGEASP